MNDTSKMSSSTNDNSKRELLQYIRDDPADDQAAIGNSPRFGNDNSLNKYQVDSIEDLFRKTNSKITTNKENSINALDDSVNISPHINK